MPKNKKYWKRRFGADVAETMAAYHHHLDLRRIDDLDDEGLAYLLTHVKGVNMLDLNETEVSNESIKLLTRLEYVKELRVRECRHIDNGCTEDLNKITSLEFLHLKDTGVTIDGLLKLNALTGLTKILFSAEDTEGIKEKMLQLRAMHPGCEFVVNSIPYQFEDDNQWTW